MPGSRNSWIVRLIAIALTLAAIMVCVAHWYSRQGVDKRFIGKWSVTSPTNPSLAVNWIFGPNGRAKVVARDGTVGLHCSWKVEGTTLELSSLNGGRTSAAWFKRELELLWGKVAAGHDLADEYHEILDAGSNEISLESDYYGPITLRRLSE